jgi:hypothetical protein
MNSIYTCQNSSDTRVRTTLITIQQTWNMRSASMPTMNAVFKLAKPAVQNEDGMFPLPYPAAADVVQS